MKNKNHKSHNLKQLTKHWDQKLKESGFKDIEDRKTGALKKSGGDVSWDPFTYESPLLQNKMGYTSLTWKESQAEYFRLASQALHEKEFKNIKFKLIWQLHAEGLTNREIGQIFNMSRDKICRAVAQMAKEFCLK